MSFLKKPQPQTPAPVAPINVQYSPALKGGFGTPAVKASPAAAAPPRSPRAGFQPPKSILKSKNAAAAAAAVVAPVGISGAVPVVMAAATSVAAASVAGAIVLAKPTSVIAYGFHVDETQAVIEFMRQRGALVVEHLDRPLNANWTRFRLYDEHHVQNALRLNGLPFDGFSLLGVKTDDPDFMPSGGPAAAAAALHRPAILGVRQPQSYERVAQPTVLVEPRVRRSASWCTLLWEKFM